MTTTAPDFDIFPTIAPKPPQQATPRFFASNIPSFNPPVESPLPSVPQVVFQEPVAEKLPEPTTEPLPEISDRDSRLLAAERTLFASLPSRVRNRHRIAPPTHTAFDLEED